MISDCKSFENHADSQHVKQKSLLVVIAKQQSAANVKFTTSSL